jgi:Tol biopolymer transport system component
MANKLLLIYTSITMLLGQFGQNIVQYDNFNWFYIQSNHFDIYYYDNGISHAEYVAHEAEEAYKNISKYLDWDLTNRYSIIIYNSHNDFQQTNVVESYMYEGIGGVTELYKTRVVIPFDGSHEEFKHVIHHELVHMFINDYMYGGSLQNLITKQISYVIPLWMNEGLAEYLSGEWNTASDMWIRDLTLNYGELPSFNQLGGYLAYRGGQSVWRFITTKWGEEAIAEIFYQIKKKKSVEDGVREALGMKLSEINRQWHEYLKKTYFPEITEKQKLTEFSRQLTNHKKLGNGYNIAPAISPDGSKIAIYSNKSGNMALYLISTETGEFLKKIIQGERNSEYEELHILKPGISWSPGGKELVFSAKSGKSDALFIYDLESEKTEKIRLEMEGVFRPSWSPLGNEIAFIGNNGVKSDIYIYDISSEELVNLTDDWFSEDHVSWSPDGSDLLFISDRGKVLNEKEPNSKYTHSISQTDIYSITRGSGKISQITNTSWDETYPVMTSDNNLAFVSDKSGINNIYILNENLLNPKAITNVLTGISQLNWNSDFTQLAFSGFSESGYDIFLFVNPLDNLKENYQPKILDWVNSEKSIELKLTKKQGRKIDFSNEFKNYVFARGQKPNIIKKEKLVEIPDSSRLDSSGEFIAKKYLTRFSLDLAQGYASTNTLYSPKAMASFLWSDVLGDHKIYLGTQMQITSLRNSDYYLYYRFLPKKIDYNFLFSHTAVNFLDSQYYNSDGIHVDYYQSYLRQLMINGMASYPISRFHRFDLALRYGHVAKASLWRVGETEYGIQVEEREDGSLSTFIPAISMVWDNTLWDYIFPSKGSRLNFTFKASPKMGDNGLSFQSLILDYRKYHSITNGISLGGKIYSGYSFGDNAQRFKMGGLPWVWSSLGSDYYATHSQSNSDYELESVYFSEYVMPVRGAQINQKYGMGSFLLNMEVRLPLMIYYFPAIKYLGQISAVAFSDFGFAWNDKLPQWNEHYWDEQNPEGFIWTYGIGPRFIFLGLPWQLDYAWHINPYKKQSKDRSWFLTIGLDF